MFFVRSGAFQIMLMYGNCCKLYVQPHAILHVQHRITPFHVTKLFVRMIPGDQFTRVLRMLFIPASLEWVLNCLGNDWSTANQGKTRQSFSQKHAIEVSLQLCCSVCRHGGDHLASVRRPLEYHTVGRCPEGAGTSVRMPGSQQQAHVTQIGTGTRGTAHRPGRTAAMGCTGQTQVGRTTEDALRQAFREGMLEDIVKGSISDDAGLQQLFDRWVQVNPVQHRPALEKAIKDVQVRLDSPL